MNALKQIKEHTWVIINKEKEVIDTITENTIINYCRQECEMTEIDYMWADLMTDQIWLHIVENNNDIKFVDIYSIEYEKFLAWVDYISIEYLAKEIVARYKQRLLNFE